MQYSSTATLFLAKLRTIRVNKVGDRSAPHKPLLLLAVLGRLQRGLSGWHPFIELEPVVTPVLSAHTPHQKTSPQLIHPFWYLCSDGLWEIANREEMERQRSGLPTMAAFRASSGRLPAEIETLLVSHPVLLEQAIQTLLSQYFPENFHNELRQQFELQAQVFTAQPDALIAAEKAPEYGIKRRHPNFRRVVLVAYEHRCAVTGFRAALDGRYFGVEAAHIRRHCDEGPDQIDNGLALNPTIHHLFDRGAWSITDDNKIIVSALLTGDDETTKRLRGHHGKALHKPLPGYPSPNTKYIRWHREGAGAVFRSPALPL
jgi:putative restriction endonuclease